MKKSEGKKRSVRKVERAKRDACTFRGFQLSRGSRVVRNGISDQ